MRIAPLDRTQLDAATRVLAAACAFDRAADVADEKLFAPGPSRTDRSAVRAPQRTAETSRRGPPFSGGPSRTETAIAFGALDGSELVGVAAVSARWLRLIAVVPEARGAGIGSALLAQCEAAARSAGEPRLRALDQPGNYLAPGVDERNHDAIGWLERRGFVRGELRDNVLIAVRDNPRVTSERAAELAARCRAAGYEIRRARGDETALCEAVAAEFGGAWPFELARALGHEPAGAHVAIHAGAYCGFAAHDGNNRGLGWFGPTGTWPSHRGKGLGEALLVACLVDVGAAHERCEVAWIGPRPFYEKVAGIVGDRRFVSLVKPLI